MKEIIDDLLYEYGFRRDTGHKKGWYWKIQADGPPGLTHDEQELNRRGGRYYGTDSISLLKETIADSDDFSAFEEDEMSDRMKWERNWRVRAVTALSTLEK